MSRYARIAAAVLGTLALLWALWQLRGVVLLFLVSLGVAAALRPGIEKLRARGWPRWAALGIVFGTLVVLTFGLALGVAGPLVLELETFVADVGQAHDHIVQLGPDGSPWEQSLARQLPAFDNWVASWSSARPLAALANVASGVLGLFEVVVNMVMVAALSLYWTMDHIRFERLWLSVLPLGVRTAARDGWRDVEREVGSYIRSESLQSLAAGVLLGIGYWALGYRYPMLLAFCGAAAWLIPWVGVLVVAAAALALAAPAIVLGGTASFVALTVPALIHTALVLVFLEWYVEPRLFDRRRYNGLLILLLVIVLAQSFGLLGVVAGPPLAVAIQILGAMWIRWRNQAAFPAPPPANLSERVARLRATLAEEEVAAPQLLNLVDRLAGLLEEAQESDEISLLPPRVVQGEDGVTAAQTSAGAQ